MRELSQGDDVVKWEEVWRYSLTNRRAACTRAEQFSTKKRGGATGSCA